MKFKLFSLITSSAMLFVLSGCKPDEMEVEIYTSDIQKVISKGEVIELPMTATFSLMGEDEDDDFSRVEQVTKRYLGDNAEFKRSKGDFGEVMVVKCQIPMGTRDGLKSYLEKSPRPIALTINGSTVKLEATEHLEGLNDKIEAVNRMFGAEIAADTTILRIIGDMAKAPAIMAIAVFVDSKPELVFSTKLARRDSIAIDYRGSENSVYSEIPPQFKILF